MFILLYIFLIANIGYAPFVSGQIKTNSLVLPTGTKTPSSPSAPSPDAGLYYCSEAFAPLDEEQTLVFDQPAPEAAGYCKSQSGEDDLTCALRSCRGFTTCAGCSLVTSPPTASKATTDGILIDDPQECKLAYYNNPNPQGPSLCLKENLDVLQCTRGCTDATACGTCFKVTEKS